jgi:glycosyltransferase involved in cell wall biosynthesis
LRIVHALHAFPPFSRAGSENYVEALAQAQRQRHEVIVFHRVSDPAQPEYAVREDEYRGIPVVRVNRTFRDLASFRDTYRSDAVAAAFGAFLDRARPDVVHFHHVTCLSTTCVGEARRRGVGVVFTLHDFWLLCPRGQRLRRDLSLCERHDEADCVRCMAHQLPIRGGHPRLLALDWRAAWIARWPLPGGLRRRLAVRPFASEEAARAAIAARTDHVRAICAEVDRFVSPSRFLRDRFVAWGLPAERIAVIDNGFVHAPRVARSTADAPADRRLRAVYLGTWIPSKGVHLLVEAFRRLPPDRAVLDVHGYAAPYDGFPDYEQHLRRLAGGAAHVRFHGAYGPEDVSRILATADVLVVPSLWWENSPLTIHEAFLAGVPVVAAGHGGMAEFVQDGLNGLTFQPGNAVSLRGVLRRLVDDRTLLQRLAHGPMQVSEMGAHAQELEALYAEIGRP